MADVFISYCHDDRLKIIRLVRALEARGWSVWWDRTLIPGELWNQTIVRELRIARCVIVAWSDASVKSDYVKEEAGIALAHNKLIPVSLDQSAPSAQLSAVEVLDFSRWLGAANDETFVLLEKAVERMTGDKTINHGDVSIRINKNRTKLRVFGITIGGTFFGFASGVIAKPFVAAILVTIIVVGGYVGYDSIIRSHREAGLEKQSERAVVNAPITDDRADRKFMSPSSKVVGIVFDDSGSMVGRANSPVFGIQVLAASLTKDDHLYGLTFQQHLARQGPQEFDLSTDTAQQASIDALRRWARSPRVSTPYEPVEVMLSHLVKSSQPDQDVHVFIFTDGEFNSAPPEALLEEKYQQVKHQLFGERKVRSFRAHFIAFAKTEREHELIKAQRIAATLSRVFNGREGDGVEFVATADALRELMVKVISNIVETNSTLSSRVIVRDLTKIEVNPQFPVRRVIIISYVQEGRVQPKLTGWPLREKSKSLPRELKAFMAERDNVSRAGAGAETRWQANISHLDFLPAIEVGRSFALEFDQAINRQTIILLQR